MSLMINEAVHSQGVKHGSDSSGITLGGAGTTVPCKKPW